MRIQNIVLFGLLVSIVALTACENGLSVLGGGGGGAHSESPGSPAPTSDPNGCYVYKAYPAVDCKALVSRSTLTGKDKTDYTYPSSSSAQYKAPSRLIDLTKTSLDVNVSKNFKLSEFVSLAKGRYAYIAEYSFKVLQSMRDGLGKSVMITSGYRSPAYNKSIDGASVSRHTYGDGFDIATTNSSNAEMQKACRAAGASYIQLYTDGHIHCDWRDHALDPIFLDIGTSSIEVLGDSEEEFTQKQYALSGEISIVLDGELQVGQTIGLLGQVSEQEEADPLKGEWIIESPSGAVAQYEGNPLSLRIEESGTYKVHARIGGYVETTEEMFIP